MARGWPPTVVNISTARFLVGSDSAISQQHNAESRAAFEQAAFEQGQLSSCCILPLNVQLDGGRTCRLSSMEGGHRSNLFELASGNKGAWPARSVSRAMRATPSKSRTWADMPPTFLRARTEALQTARLLCSVGPTFSDFTIWILRVCAARSH